MSKEIKQSFVRRMTWVGDAEQSDDLTMLAIKLV